MYQALNVKQIRITFRRHDGTIVEDAIRGFFNHETLLEPYARNTVVPAAILTQHSWIPLTDIVEFVEPTGTRGDSNLDSKEETEDTPSQVAEVDFDESYSISAGDEEVDTVYFDVAQDEAGQWYMSASLDCESSHFTTALVVDDGPYNSRELALLAGLSAAREWMAANGYSDYEVDSRLHHLVVGRQTIGGAQ